MRLRYAGAQPVTFIGVGALNPDDVFEVPDDQADGWLRRADVEEAAADTQTAKARKAPKTPTDKHIAAPAAPEEAPGVPHDH
jgi:hypothetical protein